jgi:arylsulfatase A-like enzyme
VLRGFDEVKVDRYLTEVFTDEAVDFITRHRDQPFFLYLSHTTPHAPLQATAQYLDRYRHIEDPRTRVYSAMVAALDDSVGRVVETLEAIGQYDDTLIVFASDNGCADYVRGACSNDPRTASRATITRAACASR